MRINLQDEGESSASRGKNIYKGSEMGGGLGILENEGTGRSRSVTRTQQAQERNEWNEVAKAGRTQSCKPQGKEFGFYLESEKSLQNFEQGSSMSCSYFQRSSGCLVENGF